MEWVVSLSMSHASYEWVMSHIHESCLIWRSHKTKSRSMAVGLTVLNVCHSYMIWMSVNHIWMGVIHVWMPVWMSVTNQWVSRTLIRMSVTNTPSECSWHYLNGGYSCLNASHMWSEWGPFICEWVTLICERVSRIYDLYECHCYLSDWHSFRCRWITLMQMWMSDTHM